MKKSIHKILTTSIATFFCVSCLSMSGCASKSSEEGSSEAFSDLPAEMTTPDASLPAPTTKPASE